MSFGSDSLNLANTTFHREATASFQGAIDQFRKRSEGVLTSQQLHWCRTNGIPLAFDPMQCGWVPLECEDDLDVSYPDDAKSHVYPKRAEFSFRPWRVDDAPCLAAMLSSDRLWHYLPEEYSGPIDVQTAAHLIEVSREPHHEVLAVLRDGSVIGQARLLFKEPGIAEISYWLGENHWGKGYGSEVVSAFCARSLHRRNGLQRLFARVRCDHQASLRILEKAGFVQTARDGRWLILDLIPQA